MRQVAILGAGISGLACAYYLRELAAQRGLAIEISVYDRAPRAGGCVETICENGFTMELGPDSILVDKPAGMDLLRRLGLDGDLVGMIPQFKGARIVHRGSLRRIPPDFRLFAPTSLPALLGSGIFTPAGLARAAMEPFVPRRNGSGDESLASFVTRRFGREVLDRLAQPLIGGIYSGDPERLSMEATLPQFLELERKYGSVLRAMQANKGNRPAPKLMSLRRGLGAIIEALERELHDAVRVLGDARSARFIGDRWRIEFADGSHAHADALVCATPAYVTAALVERDDPELALRLRRIRYNSIATVNLAYDAAAVPDLPPTPGFVVPYVEKRRITAATIATQKYPERAPADAVLLRAFAGGALQPELLEADDSELVAMARAEFESLLGIKAEPRFSAVRRWKNLLPEYGVGHVALIQDIEDRATALPAFALAGSAYHGVGLPDCIQTGRLAADRMLGIMYRT